MFFRSGKVPAVFFTNFGKFLTNFTNFGTFLTKIGARNGAPFDSGVQMSVRTVSMQNSNNGDIVSPHYKIIGLVIFRTS